MLNLVKLCVGVSSLEELQAHIDFKAEHAPRTAKPFYTSHITRMTPKRIDELLNGGSLYWVIKGRIMARQYIIDIEQFKDIEGISRCEIFMEGRIIATEPQPRAAFQGWRYLKADDAPSDIGKDNHNKDDMFIKNLADLGLL